MPGIRVPDDSDLRFIGSCSGASCVEGGVEEDPSVTDSTFFNYGDLDWDGLVAYATKRLAAGNYQNLAPSVTDDDLCDISDPTNWGDPLNDDEPCTNYFPIIYVAGDLTVNTGVGQGLLLVDGDLNAQGNFTFYGIVIVRGRLRTSGSGNHFNGGVGPQRHASGRAAPVAKLASPLLAPTTSFVLLAVLPFLNLVRHLVIRYVALPG
jgi:hypothetical protein